MVIPDDSSKQRSVDESLISWVVVPHQHDETINNEDEDEEEEEAFEQQQQQVPTTSSKISIQSDDKEDDDNSSDSSSSSSSSSSSEQSYLSLLQEQLQKELEEQMDEMLELQVKESLLYNNNEGDAGYEDAYLLAYDYHDQSDRQQVTDDGVDESAAQIQSQRQPSSDNNDNSTWTCITRILASLNNDIIMMKMTMMMDSQSIKRQSQSTVQSIQYTIQQVIDRHDATVHA